MSDLIVIVYPSEQKAEEVRQRLLQLQQEYLIEPEDSVIAAKTPDGNVKLNQLISPTSIGMIGALLLTPAMVATADTAGAVEFIRNLASHLKPGNAALFLLIRKMTTGKVLEALKGTGGTGLVAMRQ